MAYDVKSRAKGAETATRRKGEWTRASSEQELPHQVELIVPESGFGAQLLAIEAFHIVRGLHPRGHSGDRINVQDTVRWHFAKEDDASAFQAQFGGRLVR